MFININTDIFFLVEEARDLGYLVTMVTSFGKFHQSQSSNHNYVYIVLLKHAFHVYLFKLSKNIKQIDDDDIVLKK